MTTHLATKKMQDDLKRTFEKWDEDGDGCITRKEFIHGYKKICEGQNMEAVEERANAMFDEADFDGNGEIDFGEYCAASINKNELLNEKNLKAAFDLFDVHGTGQIAAAEIGQILGRNL